MSESFKESKIADCFVLIQIEALLFRSISDVLYEGEAVSPQLARMSPLIEPIRVEVSPDLKNATLWWAKSWMAENIEEETGQTDIQIDIQKVLRANGKKVSAEIICAWTSCVLFRVSSQLQFIIGGHMKYQGAPKLDFQYDASYQGEDHEDQDNEYDDAIRTALHYDELRDNLSTYTPQEVP